MSESYGEAWVCVDCYFAHHYGAHEHEGQWFAGESDSPSDREPLALLEGYELADNTDVNQEFGEETGEQDFSWRSCDGCGSTLGGSRHRLAVFERADVPQVDDGYVSEGSSGPLLVQLDSRVIGSAPDVETAFKILARAMRETSYWPNLWYVNERGNMEQVSINLETGAYRFAGASYV